MKTKELEDAGAICIGARDLVYLRISGVRPKTLVDAWELVTSDDCKIQYQHVRTRSQEYLFLHGSNKISPRARVFPRLPTAHTLAD